MVDGRRVRGEQRRQALMLAAVAVIARDGISAVTHRGVANACGSSLASVTYHYPTIAELKDAVFDWIGNQILEAMEQNADDSSSAGGDAAEVAGEFAFWLCSTQRDLTIALLQLHVAATGDERLRSIVDRLTRRAESIVGRAVDPLEAPAVVAAIQGVLLLALARQADPAAWARDSVRALVQRYKTNPGGRPPAALTDRSRTEIPS